VTMPEPQERMAELERMIGDYPYRVADLSSRLAGVAERTVTGQDAGGLVTVTVTGGGRVLSVRVSVRALRDLDDRRLADCVRDAANDALARAEAMLAEAAGEPDIDDVDRRLAAFESRMDDMLYEMDRMDRMLDRIGE
jgi:DNA-binding protein YbaB